MKEQSKSGEKEPEGEGAGRQSGAEAPIERREALRRMGKYAAYAPPTILTVLLPYAAKGQVGSPPPPPEGSMSLYSPWGYYRDPRRRER
jgi:hypothetical protein